MLLVRNTSLPPGHAHTAAADTNAATADGAQTETEVRLLAPGLID